MESTVVLITVISILIILAMTMSGMWLFAALGIAGLICAAIFKVGWGFLPFVSFSHANSFTLTAIPMYVLMGELMLHTGVADYLYRGSAALLRKVPGALFHVVVMTNVIFGAICGSAAASTATIGSISIPQLGKRGYDKRITYGLTASAGTLGNLIPPALGFIIYGEITKEPVSRLFIGGIVPGVFIAALFALYIIIAVKIKPSLAPVTEVSYTWKQTLWEAAGILPFLLIILLVLGSIFSGLATPTESAALGILSAIIFAAVRRKLTWSSIRDSGFNTLLTTSMIMLIIVFTYIMAGVYGALGVADNLMRWSMSAGVSPPVMVAGMIMMYLVLGCFIEGLPLKVLTLAIVYQVLVVGMGYNGIWLGVLTEIVVNIGLLTPPVGICLFVVQGIAPGSKLSDIVIGSIPFVLIMTGVCFLLIFWPQLAIWLPNLMLGKPL